MKRWFPVPIVNQYFLGQIYILNGLSHQIIIRKLMEFCGMIDLHTRYDVVINGAMNLSQAVFVYIDYRTYFLR